MWGARNPRVLRSSASNFDDPCDSGGQRGRCGPNPAQEASSCWWVIRPWRLGMCMTPGTWAARWNSSPECLRHRGRGRCRPGSLALEVGQPPVARTSVQVAEPTAGHATPLFAAMAFYLAAVELSLTHSGTAFVGARHEKRHLHACFRSLLLFALLRNAGATLSGERKRYADQQLHNQKHREDPPHTLSTFITRQIRIRFQTLVKTPPTHTRKKFTETTLPNRSHLFLHFLNSKLRVFTFTLFSSLAF